MTGQKIIHLKILKVHLLVHLTWTIYIACKSVDDFRLLKSKTTPIIKKLTQQMFIAAYEIGRCIKTISLKAHVMGKINFFNILQRDFLRFHGVGVQLNWNMRGAKGVKRFCAYFRKKINTEVTPNIRCFDNFDVPTMTSSSIGASLFTMLKYCTV